MTARQLLQVASEVLRRYPLATIERNAVGNLAVVDQGDYVGWINVRTGEFADFGVPE